MELLRSKKASNTILDENTVLFSSAHPQPQDFPKMLNLLLVSLTLTGQAPALEIAEPRSTYGHLGAVRPKTGMLPGDIAFFSFGIKNLKLDDNGLAKYSVAIEVRDAKGKLFYEQKPFNAVAQNVFGGDTVPCSASVSVPMKQPPTDLSWKITVKDRSTDKSVELKGEGKVLPADFGIVRVGTFADAESQVAIAPAGVVGGTVYLNFSAVGFGRGKDKKPDLKFDLKVLDEAGKPTLKKDISGAIKEGVPDDAELIPLHFGLSLNRPGRYTVEINSRCAIGDKTATVSLPIRILPMD